MRKTIVIMGLSCLQASAWGAESLSIRLSPGWYTGQIESVIEVQSNDVATEKYDVESNGFGHLELRLTGKRRKEGSRLFFGATFDSAKVKFKKSGDSSDSLTSLHGHIGVVFGTRLRPWLAFGAGFNSYRLGQATGTADGITVFLPKTSTGVGAIGRAGVDWPIGHFLVGASAFYHMAFNTIDGSAVSDGRTVDVDLRNTMTAFGALATVGFSFGGHEDDNEEAQPATPSASQELEPVRTEATHPSPDPSPSAQPLQ